MADGIDIAVMPNRTRVHITLHSRETSLEEIAAELRKNKIVAGIRWDLIEAGLSDFKASDQDTFSMLAAEADKPTHLLRLGTREVNLSVMNHRGLRDELVAIHRCIPGTPYLSFFLGPGF